MRKNTTGHGSEKKKTFLVWLRVLAIDSLLIFVIVFSLSLSLCIYYFFDNVFSHHCTTIVYITMHLSAVRDNLPVVIFVKDV